MWWNKPSVHMSLPWRTFQLTIILIHKTTKFRICILYYFSKDAETIFNTLSPFLLLTKLSNVNKWPWGQKYCGLELSSSCGIGFKGVSINWSVLYFIIFISISCCWWQITWYDNILFSQYYYNYIKPILSLSFASFLPILSPISNKFCGINCLI